MAKHIDTGRQGELMAEAFFRKRNYIILEKNWRFGHKEVDLIARKEDIIHFIEVKTRSGETFGPPEENVTKAKIRFLMAAAEQYFEKHPTYNKAQFDVLSITLFHNAKPGYFLIEDVYDYE